ncbi:hypothetical protein [Streptomyces sp. NBC_00057]|uniref:hypothetical protein n=1 Tax=Streptomyces sp. NBC_00057 TaxID=2975634 RepID=UPI00386F7140
MAEIQRQLRGLADGIRTSEALVGVRAELPGDEEGVLAPLRQEVAAARAIAAAVAALSTGPSEVHDQVGPVRGAPSSPSGA